MKKFVLLAALAVAAVSAQAQYAVEPGAQQVLERGKVSHLGYIALDANTVDMFKNQGATVYEYGPNDETRFLYFWDNTFTAGDSSYPGVDDQFDGYASLNVGTVGWSGAGYFINESAGASTAYWNDNTRFHLAYMSAANAPSSVAFIIADGKDGNGVTSAPAKIAVGAAFNDNGAVFPAVAAAPTSDWQGIDLSFADLKKLYPGFAPVAGEGWTGNMLSLLAGGVTGQNICLDAIYFYQLGEGDGVEGVGADAQMVVTNRTINTFGTEGISLYDFSGKLVKRVAGTVMGLDNVAAGCYVARSGKAVSKVFVK